jgi:beta-aspartyl-peptidase (threonine type)
VEQYPDNIPAMKHISLAIHGGAGAILREVLNDEMEAAYLAGLRQALTAGWEILSRDGSALDAVEGAVRVLEDDPLFNAGRGAAFTHEGTQELDAAIMDGRTLNAGSVASVRNVRNPIRLARTVMEVSPHLMLTGAGAVEFARQNGIALADDEYFYDEYRYQQLLEARQRERIELDHSHSTGTVGAVALDAEGNLAAATSTGGMTNKRFGRVGDSCIIGAGTYASNLTCAVSCTGQGEYFMRSVTAYDLSSLIEHGRMELADAGRVVLDKVMKLGGRGGLIAIDRHGNISLPFNTEGMYRACIDQNEEPFFGIFKEDDE